MMHQIHSFNFSADSLSTQQERVKLTDSLFAVLGQNPDVHAHIVNIRPLTEILCEVEIFVTKVGSGKINAKELFAYLDHPDRANIKKEKLLQCVKIVPRVEMNHEDIKRYLSSPPKGFSENEWRQAIVDNPDQQNLLPYPIYGYKELDDRRQRQLKERDTQRKSLGNLNDRLKTAAQDIQQINGLKHMFNEDAKRLRYRILRIIAASHNNSYQNAVSVEEEKLLSRLETIAVCVNAPNRLHDRIENLHDFLRSNKEGLENRKKEASDHQSLSEEESAALKRYLNRRQQDLDIISDSLQNNIDDVQIMLKEQL
uniref:Nucleoporin Nup54 alpha-helical domain-containing protein n=1 Tax=Panagrolaimus superbus TaxID=310955 RepID=A0A914YSN2_9BILA